MTPVGSNMMIPPLQVKDLDPEDRQLFAVEKAGNDQRIYVVQVQMQRDMSVIARYTLP